MMSFPGAPGKDGRADEDCTAESPDPIGFHVNGTNVRRVEPRNTPTTINAAFNHRNFWDGRANNIFNGVDPNGQRNTAARVLENQGGSVAQIQVAFEEFQPRVTVGRASGQRVRDVLRRAAAS